jgi:uncharacterized protein (TIGR03382 family)
LAAAPARAGEDEYAFGVRATPRPLPADAVADAPEPGVHAGTAMSNVFFLNYDGVQIVAGPEDSSQNSSQFPDFAMNYAPYGNGAKRAASFQAFQADWAPYDVVITDQRPGGSYTMCVNSPTNPFGNGVLGIAPLDCNDTQARNIVFAYHSDSDQFPASTQATTMSQEIAHAFGLEHVSEPNDVMNPYNAGGDPKFLDQCLPLDGGGMGIICGNQHAKYCGGNGQNSHQELLGLFGSKAPDNTPPTVAITFPTPDSMFAAGAAFNITADASDAGSGVATVQLFIDGQGQTILNAAPYQWGVNGIPAGNYCVSATAVDFADNQADSSEVCFNVVEASDPTGDPPPTTDPTNPDPSTTGVGTDSDGDTGGPVTSSDPSAGESGGPTEPQVDSLGPPALPPGYGQDADEAGCECDSDASAVPTAGLLVLVLAALGRRRRAA